jgi:hypothetical protein
MNGGEGGGTSVVEIGSYEWQMIMTLLAGYSHDRQRQKSPVKENIPPTSTQRKPDS